MRNRALFIGCRGNSADRSGHAAAAATRCVKPGGGSGCFSSNTAVRASVPADTIQFAHGTTPK